jgi:hypothetical protein
LKILISVLWKNCREFKNTPENPKIIFSNFNLKLLKFTKVKNPSNIIKYNKPRYFSIRIPHFISNKLIKYTNNQKYNQITPISTNNSWTTYRIVFSTTCLSALTSNISVKNYKKVSKFVIFFNFTLEKFDILKCLL